MNTDLQDLPEEVRAEIERPQVERGAHLEALGMTIAKLRDEAVAARKDSGIEATWLECEEAYLGIDDANRGEFDGARWAKPMSMDGPLVRRSSSGGDGEVKATAFVRLTSRYVDAGTAKVCEIALPIDGKPFTLKATPVPDLSAAAEDETPAEQVTGQPMPGPDGQPVTVQALAKHAISKAEGAAEKAAARIHDWMVEYKHAAEVRKLIFDGARIGVGVIKGPIPESRTARVLKKTAMPDGSPGPVTVEIVKKIKPAARWVDPWCFYPAPGCGEDIHKGGHCFEVDPMLPGELRALADGEGFINEAIARVIEEGPGKHRTENGNPKKEPHKKQFDVWHFHGKISRKAFEAANAVQSEEIDKDADQVFAVVTLVNDTVIRAILPPLDSGRLPYNVFNWRRRAGHWAGVGVGEQVRAPQRIVNSATRAMLNNAGHSSDAHVVMHATGVRPANGDPRMTPGKLWYLDEAAGITDVRAAFASFTWPNMTPQLMTVVEYGFKLAEEHSSIPLITQGQSGKTTPDTFSGQQLQDNNANQMLRDVGFGLNDTVTTPLVDDFYEWLLLDPDVPEEEKGDYQVDTSGALAIIEKALQDMFLPQMLMMSKDPAYELNPALVMREVIRSKRMSPDQFRYTDAELEKLHSQPPPPPPQVQAAQIRAESAEKIAQSRDALIAEKTRVDTDRDTSYVESQMRRDDANAQLKLEELRLKVRLAELEYATQERISLQEAKVKLATTTMELQTQKELAGMDGKGPEVATPPTEPPGRAEDGEAYQA